jgi:hypothetical protein
VVIASFRYSWLRIGPDAFAYGGLHEFAHWGEGICEV